jgi:ADP-ribosylglycohydrolase
VAFYSVFFLGLLAISSPIEPKECGVINLNFKMMRYSLLSRFQGGLVGSTIGEIGASSNREIENRSRPDHPLSHWNKLGMAVTEHLIRTGQLSPEDWEQIGYEQKIQDWRNTANSGEMALATLPVALFFHDSPGFLREQLRLAAPIWLHPTACLDAVLLWGEAIALALREKLNPQRSISQLLRRSDSEATALRHLLEPVQTFLSRGSPLAQVVAQISDRGDSGQVAIALALYCFAATPEDFRLCVLRASQTNEQASLTTALTGALAGTYNSFSGIPIDWRLAIQRAQTSPTLFQYASHLLTVWSGTYQPSLNDLSPSIAVSSALVMQPRSSLNIISQREISE